ncbi:MAG: hypothetical protein JO266_22865 [Acidobacteria bacterium]|nr:hypothetical protein [Acidobacteriota bacterium]
MLLERPVEMALERFLEMVLERLMERVIEMPVERSPERSLEMLLGMVFMHYYWFLTIAQFARVAQRVAGAGQGDARRREMDEMVFVRQVFLAAREDSGDQTFGFSHGSASATASLRARAETG